MNLVLFFDASCLFPAIKSPSGGAGTILKIASRGELDIVITETVFNETCRNLRKVVGEGILPQLEEAMSFILLQDSPTAEEEEHWKGVTAEKDLHILAGAIKTGADILISFDKRHILNDAVKSVYPLPIMSPAEFIDFVKIG